MVTMSGLLGRGLFLCSALILGWQVSAGWVTAKAAEAADYSWQKEVIARVEAIQGDTKVQRAGEAKFKKVRAKSPLYVMDFLATGRVSKLWWHGTFNAFTPSDKWKPGPDVTHGSLGADSVFGFKQFVRTGASYQFVGFVRKGSVRFIKTLPKTNPPSTFAIGTQTAWIEVISSDRAADFIVESKNESLTTVTVLWGKIRVRNASPDAKESRILTSCQEVDVELDQEPSDIKWVSTDTMKELVKRTTIPGTLPEDVPSCERLKKEVLLDVRAVFLPPPGVALFPVVPVPVPVPGDKTECCPPGQIYDPRTGKCVCPCPESERPPSRPMGSNGVVIDGYTGECQPCRRGATFNPQTCSCECPCPQGFLLPGQGCVSGCPAGYSEAYDSSDSPPYRCKYCVPTGIVVDPVPPPPSQCQTDNDCGPCEICSQEQRGRLCIPKQCPIGQYLDRVSCECKPVNNDVSVPCRGDADCPSCQVCRSDGKCVQHSTCSDQERLNLSTCKCEPVNGVPEGRECTDSAQCPRCSRCWEGRCRPRAVCPEDRECTYSTQCPLCYSCEQGRCQTSRQCPGGQVPIPARGCECGDGPQCPSGDDDCGAGCFECRYGGFCEHPVCRDPGERWDPDSCECKRPAEAASKPPTQPQCKKGSDCPSGQMCHKGKCVKKPPPVRQPPQEPTTDDPFTEDSSIEEPRDQLEDAPTRPRFGIGIGIGGGIGGGGQRVAPPPKRPPSGPK